MNEKIIRELREEIETLRLQLSRLQTTTTGGEIPQEKIAEMEEMIANLQRAKENVRGVGRVHLCADLHCPSHAMVTGGRTALLPPPPHPPLPS